MSSPGNQMAFLRTLLYSLKQTYGSPADIYYESADTVDVSTGERSVTKLKYRVRRAVCLPTATAAESLLPLAIQQIWKRGGAVETGSKVILIDRRDIPEALRVETHNWSVVIDRRRYEVLKVEEYEANFAYLVTLKELVGARVYEHVEISVVDQVEEVDSASGS